MSAIHALPYVYHVNGLGTYGRQPHIHECNLHVEAGCRGARHESVDTIYGVVDTLAAIVGRAGALSVVTVSVVEEPFWHIDNTMHLDMTNS